MNKLIVLCWSFFFLAWAITPIASEDVYEFTESELTQVLDEHGQEVADRVAAELTRDFLIEKEQLNLEIETGIIDRNYWESQALLEAHNVQEIRSSRFTWTVMGVTVGFATGIIATLLIGVAF